MLKLKYPMQHGVVDDWGDMEKVWSHVYQKELKAAPEEHRDTVMAHIKCCHEAKSHLIIGPIQPPILWFRICIIKISLEDSLLPRFLYNESGPHS